MNDQNNELFGKKLTDVMDEIPELRSEKLDELLSNVNSNDGHTADGEVMKETFKLLNT